MNADRMQLLRGPLPTFGEKDSKPRQGSSMAGSLGPRAGSPSGSPGSPAMDTMERRPPQPEASGMRLITDTELQKEREYWSDQIMKMALDQVQVTMRKFFGDRDSDGAGSVTSVQGDSGGSREGTAALTSRLNSMELRMAADADKVSSAMKKIEEVKAAVSMLTVELAEERREREDTSRLAAMAVQTTQSIINDSTSRGGSSTAGVDSMASTLVSIDESNPVTGQAPDERLFEMLAQRISAVGTELRSEVSKDVAQRLHTELSADTARQVSSLQTRVQAFQGHVVNELKRFATSFEDRLSTVEQKMQASEAQLGQSGSQTNFIGRLGTEHSISSSGGAGEMPFARSAFFQDDMSGTDALSITSGELRDPLNLDQRDPAAFIPESLKNELQGLVNAVGNVISSTPVDKQKGVQDARGPNTKMPSSLMRKVQRSSSPVRLNSATPAMKTSQAARGASADASSLLGQAAGREASTEKFNNSQAGRGISEPPASLANSGAAPSPSPHGRKLSNFSSPKGPGSMGKPLVSQSSATGVSMDTSIMRPGSLRVMTGVPLAPGARPSAVAPSMDPSGGRMYPAVSGGSSKLPIGTSVRHATPMAGQQQKVAGSTSPRGYSNI